MTLTPFTPETLDQLALEILDVAATIRGMARTSRDENLVNFYLHGNKVQEWLGHLRDWAHEGDSKLHTLSFKQRGMRRAQDVRAPIVLPAARPKRPKKSAARGKRKK